jgi:hypothetical protein
MTGWKTPRLQPVDLDVGVHCDIQRTWWFKKNIYIYTYIYIYIRRDIDYYGIYIYMYVCVNIYIYIYYYHSNMEIYLRQFQINYFRAEVPHPSLVLKKAPTIGAKTDTSNRRYNGAPPHLDPDK